MARNIDATISGELSNTSPIIIPSGGPVLKIIKNMIVAFTVYPFFLAIETPKERDPAIS